MPPADLAAAPLLPRVRRAGYRDAIAAAMLAEDGLVLHDELPVVEPLAADLVVAYAWDLPDRFVAATPALLAKAGLDPAGLRAPAVAALCDRLNTPPADPLERYEMDVGGVVDHTVGGHLEACVLLIPGFWRERAAAFAGPPVAAVPNRDTLLYCDGGDAERVARLRKLAAMNRTGELANGPPLSDALLTWTGDGWAEHAGPAD